MAKVIMAYSGDVESTVALHWLRHTRGLDVLAFSADLGQGVPMENLGERAVAAGASAAHLVDLQDEFIAEFAFPALRAGARSPSGYFLATALGRPAIVRAMVNLAREEGCELLAHAGSPVGNDQVRFRVIASALASDLPLVVPRQEGSPETPEELREYVRRHRLNLPQRARADYTVSDNLWGRSVILWDHLDPWEAVPGEVFRHGLAPFEQPLEDETVVIGFEEGLPVSLDEMRMAPAALVQRLNRLGGERGLGRVDLIVDGLLGDKGRTVHESPGAAILHQAHDALEALTLSRDLRTYKDEVGRRLGESIYRGEWFSELRRSLSAFVDQTQKYCTGDVRVRLHTGFAAVLGVRSPNALLRRRDPAEITSEEQRDAIASARGFSLIKSQAQKRESTHGKPERDRQRIST